ncbi:MAG: ATP-binding protein [Planctomycetes bacterium]|nr:ATP-binding protein [Planctomycetota bacterium]
MAELIVVTGGSYSGKTSVVEMLADLGHEVIPEAAYEVIAELTEAHGVAEQARWRRANTVEFQRRITVRQHGREVEARRSASPFVFSDRGVPDGLAYCRLEGVAFPEDLDALVASARYAHVFVLETLSSFDERLGTGRIHTRADSYRVAEILDEIYRGCSGVVTRVPEAPVAERVDLVLRTLGLSTT